MTILRGLDLQEYHAHEALSASKIKVYRQRGVRAFYERFVLKSLADDATDAKTFGQVFDDHCFLPAQQFDQRYACKPRGLKLNTTEGKAWKETEARGRHIVDFDDAQLMVSMQKALQLNSLARKLFSAGEAQVSVRRTLPAYQLQVQCRPDWINVNDAYICDLKTVERMERFELDAVTYGYHSQMALAQWIIAQDDVCFVPAAYLIVVEKQMAGRCQVFQIPEDVLQDAWAILKKDIEDIANRMRSGIWHEDQTEPTIARIPGWQRQQLVEDANA